MSKKDIRLTLILWGSVLDCHVFVGQQPVTGWQYDRKNKVRFKELNGYEIEDTLDIEIITKGKNGASVILDVHIEGQEVERLECVVEDGMTKVYKSIAIQ